MIRLACSRCDKPIQVKPTAAGRKAYCPYCRQINQVPGSAAPVDMAEQATMPPNPPGNGEPGEVATMPPTSSFDNAPTMPPKPSTEAVTIDAVMPSAPTARERPPIRANVPGYEILAELGRGGMGVVYKARQVKLRRTVALKMILAGGHASDADLSRFRTEAESIARLQHPNIVQIYDVGEHDGLPYFSLEFCDGGSLEKKLAGIPLPPRDAASLVEKLARAMRAAHDKGVVHRDLKPANILLSPLTTGAESAGVAGFGVPKVTDFGLAKMLDEAGKTQSGSIMGTPSYMSPEQAGGKTKELGPPCDIYALGAMLYECLTGRPPFRAATPLETVMQVATQEVVPPRKLNTKVPRDLETICLKCLEKTPQSRYASAEALAVDLNCFLAGDPPITARPMGELALAFRWARRYSSTSVVTALALVGGLAARFMYASMAGGELAAITSFVAVMAVIVRPRRWVVLAGLLLCLLDVGIFVGLSPAANALFRWPISIGAGALVAGILAGTSRYLALRYDADLLSVFWRGVVFAILGTALGCAANAAIGDLAGTEVGIVVTCAMSYVGFVLGAWHSAYSTRGKAS